MVLAIIVTCTWQTMDTHASAWSKGFCSIHFPTLKRSYYDTACFITSATGNQATVYTNPLLPHQSAWTIVPVYCALQVGCQAASCKVYVNCTPHNREMHTLWWEYSTLDHRVLCCAEWLAVHSATHNIPTYNAEYQNQRKNRRILLKSRTVGKYVLLQCRIYQSVYFQCGLGYILFNQNSTLSGLATPEDCRILAP
jgi:hypothetical protein